MDKITSENDIVRIIQDEFGVGMSSKEVSCHPEGDSVARVYTPAHQEQNVIDVFKGRNCRITRRCERTRGETDVVLEVMVGSSSTDSIFAQSFEEEQIYEGKPFTQ